MLSLVPDEVFTLRCYHSQHHVQLLTYGFVYSGLKPIASRFGRLRKREPVRGLNHRKADVTPLIRM